MKSGDKFTRLTAAHFVERRGTNQYMWLFRCDCGAEKAISKQSVLRGLTRSCGCLRVENTTQMKTTHGYTYTAEYAVWEGIRKRCIRLGVRNYSARGISVCERWESFKNFLADMGPKPSPGHSIDRIDVDGNYEPSNCRWATQKEQMNNKRSNTRLVVDGVSKTVAQWADETGLPYDCIFQRVTRLGWTHKKAVETSRQRRSA